MLRLLKLKIIIQILAIVIIHVHEIISTIITVEIIIIVRAKIHRILIILTIIVSITVTIPITVTTQITVTVPIIIVVTILIGIIRILLFVLIMLGTAQRLRIALSHAKFSSVISSKNSSANSSRNSSPQNKVYCVFSVPSHLNNSISKVKFMVDSGSTYSLLPENLVSSDAHIKFVDIKIAGWNGSPFTVTKAVDLSLSFTNINSHFNLTFLAAPTAYPILGADFLHRYDVSINSCSN